MVFVHLKESWKPHQSDMINRIESVMNLFTKCSMWSNKTCWSIGKRQNVCSYFGVLNYLRFLVAIQFSRFKIHQPVYCNQISMLRSDFPSKLHCHVWIFTKHKFGTRTSSRVILVCLVYLNDRDRVVWMLAFGPWIPGSTLTMLDLLMPR